LASVVGSFLYKVRRLNLFCNNGFDPTSEFDHSHDLERTQFQEIIQRNVQLLTFLGFTLFVLSVLLSQHVVNYEFGIASFGFGTEFAALQLLSIQLEKHGTCKSISVGFLFLFS
jgi:hypothetical protein